MAAPLGIFLAVAIPLGHSPDERGHALRAESLLHGGWLGQRGVQDGHPTSGLWADPAIANVVTLPEQPMVTTPEPVTLAMQAQSARVAWSKPGFVPAGAMAGYMPALYLPGALAVAATRAFGGGPAEAYRAIRLCNLAFYIIAGMLALRVAPRARAWLASALLLPMSLSLAGSCSQDGLLIACTVLAAACALRAPPMRSFLFLAETLLLALVIASKPPYAPLVLILMLPLRPSNALLLRACVMLVAVAPAAAWTYVEVTQVAAPIVRAASEAGPLWPGPRPAIFAGPNFAAQITVLSASPWNILLLPWRALRNDGGRLAHQLVGVLDYLCLYLPRVLYRAWFLALAASLLAAVTEGCVQKFRWRDRVFAMTGLAGCTVAVAMAMYIQWTPVGMGWIGGIQGRYFLPLLPAAALILPTVARPRLSAALSALPVLVATADVLWLPHIIYAFYPNIS